MHHKNVDSDDSLPKVTLVIGSGSVKCAAAIGVVKALADAGIGIDRVVGCSAGALFATLVALGYDTETSRDLTIRTWTRDITSQRNVMGLLRVVAPRLFGFRADNFGLRNDRMLREKLRAVFGDRRIEDTPIPLHITATDFANGELVELSRGSMVDAIRASLSLPLAFEPVRIGERLLVDGYLSDPLPVSVAMRHGSRVIVAVGFENPYQERISSAGRFAFQLSAILANNLLRSRLAFHSAAHHSELILILPQFKHRVKLFDTAMVPYIIDEGEQATLQQLPYLHSLLNADRARIAQVA
ncbi:patatin-like phospholipase family protein [Variovorax dokdonensis]|uniref:Patatin-like phospholipase family protein n=1 Tax=Variovorax dokdonensis TaxID=344883 RepID=A0ABT7N803_9BURK|nr:patatin-like phospholipase family protein [Variovorax dokdonensis]